MSRKVGYPLRIQYQHHGIRNCFIPNLIIIMCPLHSLQVTLHAMYNVARMALRVVKAERRSAEHINIQDGGPQEHQYVCTYIF